MKYLKLILFSFIGMASLPASASFITWTDWVAATTGVSGSASGTMGSVGISYTGDVTFAQLGAGINYWTEGTPAPYTGNSVVDNAPTAAEMIAMSRADIFNTITFSETVVNPLMAIVSQGRTSLPVQYDFNASFTVLSEGHGYWGDGFYNVYADDILEGFELHAVIQFNGSFDSISWVADEPEYWHGFTFGLAPQTSIPEPMSWLVFVVGLLAINRFKRT
ncbi:hypothetical protein [Pleionea sp. CnH1-48]|uniref:hypothetical protein n=1 Tax=Pleionea sp. CnH1-48 TaxID=2954494 RepID=UPI002097D5CC|nr:hypothetical protein [Pleionea sp. CnH1-48]MCO7225498.1 hypothetical protein [Pleionea sp. CnH1-48]